MNAPRWKESTDDAVSTLSPRGGMSGKVRAPATTVTTPRSIQNDGPKPPRSPFEINSQTSSIPQTQSTASTRGGVGKKAQPDNKSLAGRKSSGSVSGPISSQNSSPTPRADSISSYGSANSGSFSSISSFKTAGSINSDTSSEENAAQQAKPQSSPDQKTKPNQAAAPAKPARLKTSIANSVSTQNRLLRGKSQEVSRGNKITHPTERQMSADLRTQSSPTLNGEPRSTTRHQAPSSQAKLTQPESGPSERPQQKISIPHDYPIRPPPPPPPPRSNQQQPSNRANKFQQTSPSSQTQLRPDPRRGWDSNPPLNRASSSLSKEVGGLPSEAWPPVNSSRRSAGGSPTMSSQRSTSQRSAESTTNQSLLDDTATSSVSPDGVQRKDPVVPPPPQGRRGFGPVGSGSPRHPGFSG